jgi:quinol monooxygenase YgiN
VCAGHAFELATLAFLFAGQGSADTLTQPLEATPMLHVIAFITTKPGMREAVLREFRANMPVVRAEEGCIEYAPAVDVESLGAFQTEIGPDTFVVIEKWASAEALQALQALQAHAVAPHMVAYGAKTRDMIARRLIHVLSPA